MLARGVAPHDVLQHGVVSEKRSREKAYGDFNVAFRLKKDEIVWNSDITLARNGTASLAVLVSDRPLHGV